MKLRFHCPSPASPGRGSTVYVLVYWCVEPSTYPIPTTTTHVQVVRQHLMPLRFDQRASPSTAIDAGTLLGRLSALPCRALTHTNIPHPCPK